MSSGKADTRDFSSLPLWNGANLRQLLIDSVGYLSTGIVPSSRDPQLMSVLRRFYVPRRPLGVDEISARMESLLGSRPEGDWRREAQSYIEMRIEAELGRWRALHRGGWQLDSAMEGLEFLREARDDKVGVILWVMSFCGDIVPKICLWKEGVPFVHLSDYRHGAWPPYTKLGIWTQARMHRASERRYVTGRLVIETGDSIRYLKRLKELLLEGTFVSMAGERVALRKNVEVSILNRKTRLATGAAAFAWSTGPRLVPVYVTRLGFGRYRGTICPPIEPAPGSTKKSFVERAVTEYARLVDEQVRLHPHDWCWENLTGGRLLGLSADGGSLQRSEPG